MTRLCDMHRLDLAVGDILRLPEHHEAGLDEGPIDLLLCRGAGDGGELFFIPIASLKAGQLEKTLPRESHGKYDGLSVDWLLDNWPAWFVGPEDERDRIAPIESFRVMDGYEVLLANRGEGAYREVLSDASDFGLGRSHAEGVRRLLDREPGRFYPLLDLAPGMGPGMRYVRVMWNWFEEDGYRLMIVFLHTSSFRTVFSAHTDAFLEQIGWKARHSDAQAPQEPLSAE